MEFIYGYNAVRAVLSVHSRRQIKKLRVYYQSRQIDSKLTPSRAQLKLTEVMDMALKRNIPIQYCSKEELFRLSLERPHQNIVLESSKLDILKGDKLAQKGKDLLLYDIQDPQNLGSILRTSLLMGINRIYLSRQCSALTPVVAKASSGSLDILAAQDRIFEIGNANHFLEFYKHSNPVIIGAVNNSHEHHTMLDSGLLIVGSEGKGLPKQILPKCTCLVTYPMQHHALVESFNVSVAAALLISKLFSA